MEKGLYDTIKIGEKRERQCRKLIELSKEIVNNTFDRYKHDEIGVTWTGGKDSTLMLWVVRQVCLERGVDIPKAMIIGEGDEFEEIEDFVKEFEGKWKVPLEWCRNEDVLSAAKHKVGNIVKVKDLNDRNKEELKRLEFNDEEFEFEAESFVGNHLMKTVVFNMWMERNGIKAVFQGLRWDEHESRYNDKSFEEKDQDCDTQAHTRVRPILHFTEKDLWDTYAMLQLKSCKLYEIGYRSLGAKSTSHKNSDMPAWEQDIINSEERTGRHQDKEEIMDQLRALGYM